MDKLLEILQADGLLTEDQTRVVRIESARKAMPARSVLMDADLLSAGALDHYQAGALGLNLTAEDFVPDSYALGLLPELIARKYNVLPVTFDQESKVLVLAMDDASNLVVRDRISRAVASHINLDYRRSEATDIKRTLDKCYGACHSLNGILVELEQQPLSAFTQGDSDQTPIVRLIDAILQDAVTRRASDVHLSPDALFVSIRYRIDGVLHAACCLHVCYWPAMLVRIKVLSSIDIAETRLPQDGHVARTIHGQRIDFRVASFPVRGGENLVLRVLDRRRSIRTLSMLCKNDETQATLTDMVKQPSGLVLVCGPTGSGKTTTLYALLQSMDASKLNIMTLEDPVEYPMPNIRQTRVQGNAAFGFADGVRGVLRQDPDVIMIGEIRDADSCLMACRAAMTGHLVLTSTHAEDCIGAIGRLVELGAQRSIVASVLCGVIAQRLVRKVCSHCLMSGISCGVCAGAGYSGRVPLFESLSVSDSFSSLLHSGAPDEALMHQACVDGMKTLTEQAAEHVRQGLTNVEEVSRVLGEQLLST